MCLAKLTDSSRESHVSGFVTRIVLVSVLVNYLLGSLQQDDTIYHDISPLLFLVCLLFLACVICSFCLIADHNVECLISDRLFEMEATLIKVLHCLFFALHLILFNAFIHSFQSLALNRFNIKYHVGSKAGAVVRALASH